MQRNTLKKFLYIFIFPYFVVIGYTILVSIRLRLVCANNNSSINYFLTAFRISDIHFVTMITISHAFSSHILFKDGFLGISFIYKWKDMRKLLLICFCISMWIFFSGCVSLIPYGELNVDKWNILGLEATIPINALSHYLHLSEYVIRNHHPLYVFSLSIFFLFLHLIFVSMVFSHKWHNSIVFVILTAIVCYGDFQAYNELPSWATYVFPGSVLRCSFESRERIAYTLIYYIVLTSLIWLTIKITKCRNEVKTI